MDETPAQRWQKIDAALDDLIDLPQAQRQAQIASLAADDPAIAQELSRLVRQLGGESRLDQPASAALLHPAEPGAPPGRLPEGTLLGTWRIVGWLGAGGMGEVYRAERADGQFDQQVAIKLVRADARQAEERFQRERQIVARLAHPGIARLLDGGIGPDGRPYMVIELVRGAPIVAWCAQHRASLAQRLALFEQVCEAVAYAHRNLVVHRDIKPGNVLVGDDGRPKLLDFGVARLLDAQSTDLTRELLLTPAYASPEQLDGAPITTAADVFALGLLLHELLVGRPARDVQALPLAAAIRQVITRAAVAPSRAARGVAQAAVPAALIEGDLDAIVAKALRPEPEQRYASVDALLADLQRHRQHQPVLARQGSWSYVVGRALRRHRVATVAAAVVLLAIAGGALATAWQARVARLEAARADAVKSYLLGIFHATDPRAASDRPRGQITARELLDLGAGRVESEFTGQPSLQIELLGVLASLYRELQETDRYEALQGRRLALAEQRGDWRAQAEVWINRAGDSSSAADNSPAMAMLARADEALQRMSPEDGLLRARWWLTRAQSLPKSDTDGRDASLTSAHALYERFDARGPGLVTTRIEQGLLLYERGDNERAVALYQDALRLYAQAHDRDDGEAQTLYGNLAVALMNLGRWDEAAQASRQALAITQRTYGTAHPTYWIVATQLARQLHLGGDRAAAHALLDPTIASIPKPWTKFDMWQAAATQLDCLNAEGAGAQALPLAGEIMQAMAQHDSDPTSYRRARLRWGESLWQAGRFAQAREQLARAYADYVQIEPPERQTRMWATETWARFLLSQGEVAPARALLEQVVAQDHGRRLAHAALAQADLADVALAEGDQRGALEASAQAQIQWSQVRGFRDVRMGVAIERARARALLAAGDRPAAHALAEHALAQSRRIDAPVAASIAEAQALWTQSTAR